MSASCCSMTRYFRSRRPIADLAPLVRADLPTARKVLLTTGLKDEIPKIEGVERLYGRSVHHCPYCDGFEYRDKPLAIYGKGDKRAEFALMSKSCCRHQPQFLERRWIGLRHLAFQR